MDTYEKKYKNALTIAQSRFKIEKDESVLTCLGMMFPELRDSEDERIRKAIIELLKEVEEDETYTGRQHIPDMLAYLEKQKEQKPAEWSEEEKDMVAFIVAMCDDGLKDCVKGSTAYRVYNEIKDWINNLRPQPKTEWSEEDEKQLDDIISIIRGAYEHGITISETRHRNAYLWLNNLRPSWKPSEEQMEVLLNAEGLVRANNYNENAKILASLYEQLKKL